MAMEDSFVEEWEKKSGKKKLEEVEVLWIWVILSGLLYKS